MEAADAFFELEHRAIFFAFQFVVAPLLATRFLCNNHDDPAVEVNHTQATRRVQLQVAVMVQ